jgi:L-rhamnose-H+ transport protein
MSILSGVAYHAMGASTAAMCYTPQKKVRQWSWQTYWLAQASVCWLILPIVVAVMTIPDLDLVLQQAPTDAMYLSFTLGAAYGIGGTAFGIAIRHIGYSLTYAFAIGISCVLGTLLPPILNGDLVSILGQTGSGWIMGGIGVGIVGIALCGLSGRMKEKDLMEKSGDTVGIFDMRKGLPLCLLSGVLASFYGLSLNAGEPIAAVADRFGAGDFRGNVIYVFSNSGAFLSTLVYCLFLHRKEGTFSEYGRKGEGTEGGNTLAKNYVLSILTGILWYSQFFFYGLGHVNLGAYQFSSWAIHMIMLVMFSALLGIVLKEWISAQMKTVRILGLALLVLLASVLMLSVGNYLASPQ